MMKTQGEIEAAICEGISRFEQEYRGRGPKDIHAYLLGDFVVVRLTGLADTRRTTTRQVPVREGEGLAQASTDPSDRNGEAAHASDGPGDHRRQGGEPASRHQHRDRRSVRCPDPGRATLFPPIAQNAAISADERSRSWRGTRRPSVDQYRPPWATRCPGITRKRTWPASR